jgi:hypothetical protein
VARALGYRFLAGKIDTKRLPSAAALGTREHLLAGCQQMAAVGVAAAPDHG